jgi:precorrin-6A/cobalt-precorrin-6A reductase
VNVLVLGGTGEARRLASALHDRPGWVVTSSLAGRVAVPSLPPGDVRVGGFGGVDGLRRWLREKGVDAVVDATHPFARQMTAHAVQATTDTGVPLLVLRREPWQAGPGDRWRRVPDAAAAGALLPGLGERVFLATGSGDLAVFVGLDRWFLLRAVDLPPPPLPARHHLVLGRGPFTADSERALLREHRVDVVVTRDSGGVMTAAKLVAARELGLPVVLLDRPPAPDVPTVATVDEAVRWLAVR